MKLDIYKIFEMIGIEEGDVFRFENSDLNYKIKSGYLYRKEDCDISWRCGKITLDFMINREITIIKKAPWKPKENEQFWTIAPMDDIPITDFNWINDNFDKNLLKRGLVFKTKEEAIAKAKELGWWEDEI